MTNLQTPLELESVADEESSASILITRSLKEAFSEMADESPSVMVDWIAQVIDPQRPSALAILCDAQTPLESLVKAKNMYKMLRVHGQSKGQRRMGRRMYAASIAAGLVHHQARISEQSDRALARAFHFLMLDDVMPAPIREIVAYASNYLTGTEQEKINEHAAINEDDLDTLVSQLDPTSPQASTVHPAPKVKRPAPPPKNNDLTPLQKKILKRDANRVHGHYDPVHGASFQTQQAYCQACRAVVEVRRKLPNTTLHIWLSMLTLGLWLPVWGLLRALARLRSWRCVNCRRHIYQAFFS
ncbi:MAG: hypothetical protein O7G85_05250 [Planctomycetota bacterium]|nr:hypothetical protein [Planctomycetota bacterium]